MPSIASLAEIAFLVGEPARTTMLVALMDGRALTAGELGGASGVGRSTASGHLTQMLDAGLLALERQGRHRYYRLSTPSVASMLESLMSLSGEIDTAGRWAGKVTTGPRDPALRKARICYDHLAGEVAVAIADNMVARGQLDLTVEGAALTAAGRHLLETLGVEIASAPVGSASFCRPCLDWSERRSHIAGAVGRAMLKVFESAAWVRRARSGRALAITPAGAAGFERHFGIAPAAR